MKRFKIFLILGLVITGLLEVSCAVPVIISQLNQEYEPISYENQYKAPLLLRTKIKIIPLEGFEVYHQKMGQKGEAFANSLLNSVKNDLIKNVFSVLDENIPKLLQL